MRTRPRRSSIADSWPTRSTSIFVRRPFSILRASAIMACSMRTISHVGSRRTKTRFRTTMRASAFTRQARGGRGRCSCSSLRSLRASISRAMDPLGPDFVHTVIECSKLAFADREVFYGDPAFAHVPMEMLLSDAYNDERRRLIDPAARRSNSVPASSATANSVRRRSSPMREGSSRAVSARASRPTRRCPNCAAIRFISTSSTAGATWFRQRRPGGWLQASPAVPGLGFNVTTRAQMFWMEEGLPSSLGPGRRPRTTLSPTLVTRGGTPYAAFGTPGGDQQDQWSIQLFPPARACRHEFPGGCGCAFVPDGAFSRLVLSARDATGQDVRRIQFSGTARLPRLRARGHDLSVAEPWSLGRVCAVGIRNGLMRGAATPRQMQAYAVGR